MPMRFEESIMKPMRIFFIVIAAILTIGFWIGCGVDVEQQLPPEPEPPQAGPEPVTPIGFVNRIGVSGAAVSKSENYTLYQTLGTGLSGRTRIKVDTEEGEIE